VDEQHGNNTLCVHGHPWSPGQRQREDGDLPTMLGGVLVAILSKGLHLAEHTLEFVDLQYELNDVVNFDDDHVRTPMRKFTL